MTNEDSVVIKILIRYYFERQNISYLKGYFSLSYKSIVDIWFRLGFRADQRKHRSRSSKGVVLCKMVDLSDRRVTESGAICLPRGPLIPRRGASSLSERNKSNIRTCGRVGLAKRMDACLRTEYDGCNPTPDKFDINGPPAPRPAFRSGPDHGPGPPTRLNVLFASSLTLFSSSLSF